MKQRKITEQTEQKVNKKGTSASTMAGSAVKKMKKKLSNTGEGGGAGVSGAGGGESEVGSVGVDREVGATGEVGKAYTADTADCADGEIGAVGSIDEVGEVDEVGSIDEVGEVDEVGAVGEGLHGKEKINTYFQAIQKRGENLFVPYIVAGDGGLERLAEQITLLEQSGVAAIELGMPFSDPVADGPTIQKAGMRALDAGITLEKVLDMLEKTRATRKVPIILMTYVNPIFAYGVETFARRCKEAGVDGLIVPDVPMEEETLLTGALDKFDVAFIRLVALTSTEERMRQLAERSEGFLYAVSVRGTTGARANYEDTVASYLQKLKNLSPVPVLAGFGVSNASQAKELSQHCDGVIVGSTIVDLFHKGKDDQVRELVADSLVRGR